MGNSKSKSGGKKGGKKSSSRSSSRQSSTSSHKASGSGKSIKSLFKEYADDTADGEEVPVKDRHIINKFNVFFEDLDIDMSTIDAMFVLYHFGAKDIGSLSYEQWKSGFSKLDVRSIEGLAAALPAANDAIRADDSKYRDFYMYCFMTARDSEAARILSTEVALPMLELLLGKYPMTSKFISYVQRARPVDGGRAALSKDEWASFWSFVHQFTLQDLGTYNDDGAWPIVIDEFVEDLKNKESKGNGDGDGDGESISNANDNT